MEYLEQIGIQAKEAEAVLRTLGSEHKNLALRKAAEYLVKAESTLLEANQKDGSPSGRGDAVLYKHISWWQTYAFCWPRLPSSPAPG